MSSKGPSRAQNMVLLMGVEVPTTTMLCMGDQHCAYLTNHFKQNGVRVFKQCSCHNAGNKNGVLCNG